MPFNTKWGNESKPLVQSQFVQNNNAVGASPPPPPTEYYLSTLQGDLFVTLQGDNFVVNNAT